jgi:predicted TIM-barrel fold metal-dependent hydrolase
VRLPSGSVDAHCHLFGPFDRYPLPPHARYLPPAAGFPQYESLRGRFGIDHAVFVQSAAYGTDHRLLLDVLRTAQGRHAGVALVDDTVDDPTIAALHEAGVRGARFHFISFLGPEPGRAAIARTLDRIVPLGWHALLHVDGAALLGHAALFETLSVPFIIDHIARVDAGDGLEQAAFRRLLRLLEHPLCWVKISGADRVTARPGAPYDDVIPFARALVAAAPQRVLWGTDWPHTNVRALPEDADLVALLEAFVPDEALR